ncbi:MAG: hypothetical protein U5K28_08550 [Halobacteriales archaeon]|nr:hypothetical protein [Halobacteriales archaeon]
MGRRHCRRRGGRTGRRPAPQRAYRCWAGDAALDGATGRETPFAVGRPPGHQCKADDAMGFCSTTSLSPLRALDRDDVDRVAVFDWGCPPR